MKNKKTLSVLLALAIGFSAAGCGAASGQSVQALLNSGAAALSADAASELSAEDLFTARDLAGEVADYETITLSGSGAESASGNVTVTDGVVKITAAGNYLLTGSFSGRIEIDAPEDAKVQLILSDAAIASDGAAAIAALRADKLFVTLADGTANSVSATGELAELDGVKADGAIFARCDLTVNGTGSLTVKSESGHGLVSKDDLKIASGTIRVEAAKQGLSGKDSVSVAGGELTVVSGTDGIHSESEKSEKGTVNLLGGSVTVSAGSDGVDATGSVNVAGGTLALSCADDGVHADAALTVSGGSVTVSRSYEGLEARDIVISGGEIDVTASDDGLNAAGGADGSGWGGRGGDPFAVQDASITISGGTLHINASGDGIDSNGDLTVSGGVITVSGPTNAGNGAIDYNGKGVISGGTLIAAGAMGMAENFSSESSQCSVCVSFNGTQAGGSDIRVCDASGKLLASFTPEKDYQCAVISTPELTLGETYRVSAGGSEQSVTLSSVITGGQSGMGGMGGFGGMGGPGGMGGFGGMNGGAPDGAPFGNGGEGEDTQNGSGFGFSDGRRGMNGTPPDGDEQSGRPFDGRGRRNGQSDRNGGGFDGFPAEDGTGFTPPDGGTDIVTSATPAKGGA